MHFLLLVIVLLNGQVKFNMAEVESLNDCLEAKETIAGVISENGGEVVKLECIVVGSPA